jgi:O-antigen/teichoic acid export membrane protein
VSGSPVLRIYLLQTLIHSVEISALLYVFKQGLSNMRSEAITFPFAVLSSLAGVWYYGFPGAAIGSVLASFMMSALFLKRLSKVTSLPIAKLQDWKNLGKIFSLSAVCAFVVRLSADLLEPSTPVAAIGGPAAVLVLYVMILFVTRYYRTLEEIRREWGSISIA